ncbi:hypothetical protein PENTCL1PPCAC_8202, partial [Pristionchus entomophagus]
YSTVIFSNLAELNGAVFLSFCVFIGPFNVIVNLFVMFILTRKELRTTYNLVFFIMALNQTLVIGTLTLSVFRTILFAECTPSFFTLLWAIFDIMAISTSNVDLQGSCDVACKYNSVHAPDEHSSEV